MSKAKNVVPTIASFSFFIFLRKGLSPQVEDSVKWNDSRGRYGVTQKETSFKGGWNRRSVNYIISIDVPFLRWLVSSVFLAPGY